MNDYSYPFKIDTGSSGGSFDMTPEKGNIVGCLIFLNNDETKNPQMVTAGLKSNGAEIAKMQPIESYRSRDVEYVKDGKPIQAQGGNLITLNIASRANFTEDLYGYVVFVYGEPRDNY